MLRMLAALALAALLGTAAAPAHAAPFEIVLLGDSITQGYVSPPVGPSYADLLAEGLGPGFEISNIGCGGASSLDWSISRGGVLCGDIGFVVPNLYEGRALPELPADLVTILLGTNDALGFFEPDVVSAADYRSAIAEIAADLLLDGASQVMLLTPPPVFLSAAALLQGAAYRLEILALCSAPDDSILCGPDVLRLLGPEDYGDGGVHPNATGHAKIASALRDSILAAVPEPGAAPLVLLGLAALALARRRARATPAG